jgi:CelD/BcsL family acetyltransferase involved in cellulose biosynthesis
MDSNVAQADSVPVDGFAELERLHVGWESLPWTRLDPERDYFLTVVRSRPEVIGVHALFLPDDVNPQVGFVGRVEDVSLRVSVGYRSVYSPKVRAITLVHGGAVGVDTRERAEEIVGRLRDALAARRADAVLLPALRTDSELYAAATKVRFPFRQPFATRSLHWGLKLPESFDEFLASRSSRTRKNLRVDRNRLQRDHGESIELRVFRDPADADELFRDVEAVAAKTYQHGLGVAFADTEDDKALILLALERGWFRAYVLYVGGVPIAFWQGSVYARTFHTGTPGYDPGFANYGIGRYLLVRVIEQLCDDDEVDDIDYGFGDAEYKRRFGNESWEEADVLLFARRFRPLWVNIIRTTLATTLDLAKRVLARAGLVARLKRRWRRRLAAETGA